MAVLGRVLVSSAERLDLADLLSMPSYAGGDWKYFLKGLVGDNKPFILKGFDVIDPITTIGQVGLSIRVADSMVFFPGSNAGAFYAGLEEGNPLSAPLIPELRANTTNFVYLTFSTFNTSADMRAFWDPDRDGGAGGEFTQNVNTESVLKVDVNVSTGSFPANTIPVARVVVAANSTITSITDCRDMMFRLGTGGLTPDPFANYNFRSLPSAGYQRTEPPTTATSGGVNPFQGGDKNIYSLKEWMDLVMTKFKELTGGTYWYDDLSTFSLVSGFVDALSTTFKSKGQWQHSSATPGLVTWTEDLIIKITQDPREYIVRAGNETLSDEQVLYIDLKRKQRLNASDAAVVWTNGQVFVNTPDGAPGYFANLKKGDWVKKANDENHLFLRVEEFYTGINGGAPGGVTPANARSIRLSDAYQGATGNERGVFDRGVYENADVITSDRDSGLLSASGGNFHWLAVRSDVIQGIDEVESFTVSGTLSEPDGNTAKIVSVGHGLQDGDQLTVTAPAGHAGTYSIEVEDVDTFYIQSADLSTGAFTAHYALLTTSARDNGYGLQLESANHNFETGDLVIIDGTTGFNGSHTAVKRSATEIQFAFSSTLAAENPVAGTATLARVNVRSEQGLLKIIQGSAVDIGGSTSDNLKQFIGMKSDNEINPLYMVSPSYNALDGMANYNTLTVDSLTERASKLTAMMADKAQDKTVKYIASPNLTTVANTTNGAAQEITFNPGGNTLKLITPGSTGTATVNLPNTAPGISLLQNQVAYVELDRNNISSQAIQITDLVSCPITENVFVIAARLDTTAVYLWDGTLVLTGGYPFVVANVVRQNQVLKLIEGGIWSWDLVTETLTWSDDAFIHIPSLANSVNEIPAGSVVLQAGEVAYVDINRAGPGGTLTVTAADSATLSLTTDRLVIARREGTDVIVGAHSMRVRHRDNQDLYGESNKINIVTVVDETNTALPTGSSVTINTISIANGDKVLFTRLSTLSERGIYVADGIGSSVTWTKLRLFNGSDLPYTGAFVYVVSGDGYRNQMYEYDLIDWKRADNADVMMEPTGFPNLSDSTLLSNSLTRTVSITPDADYFDYYIRGRRYRSTVTLESAPVPDVSGNYFFYISDQGVVEFQNSFNMSLLTDKAYMATAYWNADTQLFEFFGEERHGLSMDGETHAYLHATQGTRYISGLTISPLAALGGDGSSDDQAQVEMTGGRIRDEDLTHNIVDDPAPSEDFEQVLSGIAEIPAVYKSGADGAWVRDTATLYPFKIASGLPTYNAEVADPWVANTGTAWLNYPGDFEPIQYLLDTDRIFLGSGSGPNSFNGNSGLLHALNEDGTINTTAQTNLNAAAINNNVRSIKRQVISGTEYLVIGGGFTNFSGGQNRIVRINADGVKDVSFNIGSGFNTLSFGLGINAVEVDANNNIFAGGNTSTYNGNPIPNLAKLDVNGNLDATFIANLGTGLASGSVYSIRSATISGVEVILVSGFFTSFNGDPSIKYFVAIRSGDSDPNRGQAYTPFNTGLGASFNGAPFTIEISPTNEIYVAGEFSTFNSLAVPRCIKLFDNGTRDFSFNPTAINAGAYSIQLKPAGQVVVGGLSSWGAVRRLNSDGTVDATFTANLGSGFNNQVRSIFTQPNNRMIISGLFTTFNSNTRGRVVRLNAEGIEGETGWATVPVSADGKYIAQWIFATNNIDEPIISILGQDEYDTLSDAQGDALYETLQFGDLPFQEFKLLFRLIYRADSTYANAPNATLEDITDYRKGADTTLSSSYMPSDHGNLTGLSDDDHLQYLLLAGRTGGQTTTGGISSGNNLVLRSTTHATKGQVRLDETTNSTSPTTGALRVDGGVGIGGNTWIGGQAGIQGLLRPQSGIRFEKQRLVTTTGVLLADDCIIKVDTSAAVADITLTLPVADASNLGQVLIIKDVGGQVSLFNKRVLIAPNGGDSILLDEVAPVEMSINYFCLTLVSDGAGNWMVI